MPSACTETRHMTSRLGFKFPTTYVGGSNSPPLMHGDQIPHPREGKAVKCPGGGGGGMLKFRFDRYITPSCVCHHHPHSCCYPWEHPFSIVHLHVLTDLSCCYLSTDKFTVLSYLLRLFSNLIHALVISAFPIPLPPHPELIIIMISFRSYCPYHQCLASRFIFNARITEKR